MIERLNNLKSNRRFANGSELSKALKNDKALRQEVELLTKFFFGRKVSGCSSCYSDAYLELMNLKTKRAMEKLESKFALRAGVLLQDVVKNDISKNMSNANISNDLSLYHLRTNPTCRKFFTRLPEDIEQMLIGIPVNVQTEVDLEQPSVEPEKVQFEKDVAEIKKQEAAPKATAKKTKKPAKQVKVNR